jgi:hypothetical protein
MTRVPFLAMSSKSSPMNYLHRRRNYWVPVCLTAAAALGASSAHAFVIPKSSPFHFTGKQFSTDPKRTYCDPPPPSSSITVRRSADKPTRLYSSNNSKNDNEENNGGILSKVGGAVKSILPKRWFASKEEKKAELAQQKMNKELSGGLSEMLKDAPLGVRMLGKLITPLVSKLASKAAVAMAEQQKTTNQVLQDARGYLLADPAITDMLGDSLQVGAPFSQSSSSTSINGKTRSRTQLSVPVAGPLGQGVAQIVATEDGIAQIQVQATSNQGRQRDINVNLTKSASSARPGRGGSFSSRGGKNDDNIIEAEIIEKDTTK